MTELRARLLAETTRIVRRRRYVRRAGIAAACAGCYVAGLLTVWWADGESTAESVPQPVVRQSLEPEAKPDVPEPGVVRQPEPQRTQKSAVVSVSRSQRVKRSKFEQLRDLGDYYFHDQQDLAGATRCYQMALRYATTDEFQQQTDEGTWLYRALKLDHHQETEHAQNQG